MSVNKVDYDVLDRAKSVYSNQAGMLDEIINTLVADGKTVVMISSDMEEIMGVSDRILVMYEGTIAGEVRKEDFSQELITKYAVGERSVHV